MEKEHVKQIVRNLARTSFSLFPEGFPTTREDVTHSVEALANGYWHNRNRINKKRDQALGITREDYLQWVGEEMKKYTT